MAEKALATTRVFVDTNVLFPFSVMDLMLALTENAAHEVLWTETLLAEWQHVIVREQRRSAESAASIAAAIREFFPEFRVAEDDYAGLIAEMPGPDPDDRSHMAAAVTGGASAIITWNRSDYPADRLARWGIRVMDPDEYLCELIVEIPQEVVDTVVRLAGEKRRPPLTPYDLADSLAKAGTQHFANRLRDRLDMRQPAHGRPRRRSGSPNRGGTTMPPSVLAAEVGTYLASHRPPAHYNVKAIVPPHDATGTASHAIVLNTALVEMLTAWPDGTTLVINYVNETYVQALIYPPNILTEISRPSPAQIEKAIQFGWMDPAAVRAPHGDFESQPVWLNNPVREWTHPYDRPTDIAAFLAGSVRGLLGCDPGDGYTLHLFNIHVDNTSEG